MAWAELNADLLCLISKKLGDVSNFVRLRAVCRHWRRSTRPCDCPPQLPWFVEFPPKTEDEYAHNFFSLYSNSYRAHTLHIPQTEEKYISGPSNRYLVIYAAQFEYRSVSLFNPLTKSCFSLPQIEECTGYYPIYIGPDHNPNPNPNPNENGDIAVVFSYSRKEYGLISVLFCRFADRHLTKIVELDVPYARSIAYFQGRLFVFVCGDNSATAQTRVVDVSNGNNVLVISSPGLEIKYLIEACGELLGVVRHYKIGEPKFEVYRLEDGGTNSHWVKMTSGIEDRMLFLSGWNPASGLCLKASDFDGFTGNCIYFAEYTVVNEPTYNYWYDLAKYDLQSNETQVLPYRCGYSGTWFVPSLY